MALDSEPDSYTCASSGVGAEASSGYNRRGTFHILDSGRGPPSFGRINGHQMTTTSADRSNQTATTERQKYLFVASTGGHLAQLVRMSMVMNASDDSLWVTFDSPQSKSLLQGRRVRYVPYIASRDLMGVLRAAKSATEILRNEKFDRVLSTGAALALAVMPVAKVFGVPSRYIESVSRVQGPSVTGRIISALRLAETHTQHSNWATRRWIKHPSVLAQFSPAEKESNPGSMQDSPSVFVTLGTIRPYRFDSLVDALLATGLCNEKTTWQLGETHRNDLPGTVISQISAEEFNRLSRDSDVVVTHSGVGTILNLLEAGIHPVVVPRRKARKEHVDDHQLQIAELVDGLGIATVAEADVLSATHIINASYLRTIPASL